MSLPDADVEYLDAYARAHGLGSRSAALHRAVRLLRATELDAAYADAWTAWDEGEGADWDATLGDGLR